VIGDRQANQFRLFLHMGAYWLLHALRRAVPKKSRWRGATFATIRATFVKIACRVVELKRSIKLAFPSHLPHAKRRSWALRGEAVGDEGQHIDSLCRDCPQQSPSTRPKASRPASRQSGRCCATAADRLNYK
jgi:hypothetical protein